MAMTFRINLSTLNYMNSHQPYNYTEGLNFASTRSTWIPNEWRTNQVLKDGDTITVSGPDALYYLKNYTQGPFKCMDYVSGDA